MSILSKNLEPQIDSIGSLCTVIGVFDQCAEQMFVAAQEALQYCVRFDNDSIADVIIKHFPGYSVMLHGRIEENGYVKAYVRDAESADSICRIVIHKKRSWVY